MQGLPFDFEMPVSFFEKAGVDPQKQRRIGGIASLETRDREGEVLLSRGLSFSDFLKNGWFNDNHSKATEGILGYPEGVQEFRKGQRLPDGKSAPANGHWVEGYLLDTPKADKIWELGKALQKTNRRLGFSVEGKIQKRAGPSRTTVTKALVRNVAITNCPVHAGTRMEILAKSLQVFQDAEPTLLEKMLAVGPANPGGTPTGGAVLTKESLEQDGQLRLVFKDPDDDDDDDDDDTKKSLTTDEAFLWTQARMPRASSQQIYRFLALTRELKQQGALELEKERQRTRS